MLLAPAWPARQPRLTCWGNPAHAASISGARGEATPKKSHSTPVSNDFTQIIEPKAAHTISLVVSCSSWPQLQPPYPRSILEQTPFSMPQDTKWKLTFPVIVLKVAELNGTWSRQAIRGSSPSFIYNRIRRTRPTTSVRLRIRLLTLNPTHMTHT